MKKGLSLLFSLGFCAWGNSLLSDSVNAQVAPDGTTNTTVNSNGDNFTIENGDRAGGNLFHSFQDFSVPNGGSAVFNNAAEIENIFSRVTGGNISNINGLIQANDANLFLVNPAGILFGENARLDIGGSFLGTTADSILFEDGEFSAIDFDNPPLLTVNAPIGLNFRDNPQSIINQSVADDMGLQVDTGKNITLVGGNINFDGGIIFAPAGRVELGGLSTGGIISFNNDLSLNFPQNVARADISFNNEAAINVRADNGGSIAISSRNLEVLSQSKIRAGIAPELGKPESLAGNIDVNSTETVTISGANTFIANAVVVDAIGKAGDVNITTKSLSLENGGQANSLTQGQGDAGNVNIIAENISIDGFDSEGGSSGFFNTVAFDAVGNSGKIDIQANSLLLANGGVVQASTFGRGNAGNILVRADDSISLTNDSLIVSSVREGGIGNGGNITIETDFLTLTQGGQIQTAVFRADNGLPGGQGQGGNTTVNSSDSIDISGFSADSFSSSILTITEQGASGDAGDIVLSTGKLRLSDSGNINAATRNSSRGGDIFINANTLEATSGGQVRATTRSNGSAGNITLNISDKVDISGSDPTFSERLEQFDENFVSDAGASSGLFVNSTPNSPGRAGSLILNMGQLSLSEQGTISASSQSGEGGNIELQIAENLIFRDNGLISAQAFNDAIGGNVNINADFVIAFPNSINGNGNDIIASAVEGIGGEININAQSIFGIQEREAISENQTNDIDASSRFSLDGNVTINTPDINPIQGATELPSNLVVPEQNIAQACSNRDTSQTNTFVVRGKGGVPTLPTASLSSELITINGKPVNNSDNSGYAIPTSQGNIIPARGIVKTADGQVILTAAPVSNSTTRIPNNSINCG